jgi:hypothetical protein
MSTRGFQPELQRARQCNRGDILRAMVSFVCEEPKCPAGMARIGFVEEIGITKPMQLPLRCPRCLTPMQRYIGLEVGR